MDTISVEHRSLIMSQIRSRDTQPELLLRRILHSAGYRFRLQGAIPKRQLATLQSEHQTIRFRGGKLPGSPDLVFSARRKVIFVNGCFWHGHECAVGRHRPSSNTEYWNTKLDTNIARDQNNRHDLEVLGWKSLTVWECELKSSDEALRRATNFLGPPKYLKNFDYS